MEAGIPWAWFVRNLHWTSALGLTLATLAHVVEVAWYRTERTLKPQIWWAAVASVPVLVMALLGGYLMRGDADAVGAFEVWRGILKSLPLWGDELSLLFLGPEVADLSAAAVHHAGTFTLGLWLLTTLHGKRMWPDRRSLVLAVLLSAALAGMVQIALGPPLGASVGHRLGPWYLLGLQGLLIELPRAIGWLGPVVALALLGAVRHLDGRARTAALGLLVVLTVGYGAEALRLVLGGIL